MIIILGDVFMYIFLLILVVIYVLLQFSCFKNIICESESL